MSIQWQLPRSVPEDTSRIGQGILAETNLYRIIGDRFDELFPGEEKFAPLYSCDGRGAISPLLAALVTVFQMLEKVADRTAAEWVASRIDWKYALHLPLEYSGFHFTDLYAFRKRLLEHEQDRLVFDEVLVKLKDLGVLKARGKMRTDSTHLLAVVEQLSQYELVSESIRVTLKAVNEVAPDWVAEQLPASFRETYARRASTFGLSEVQVQQQLLQAGTDGFWFLQHIEHHGPAAVRRLEEVNILRQVLDQQFPGGPTQPPAAKRPSGQAVIESPHEPEARFGTKRGKHWTGYKAQLTETCDEALPHIVVDLEPTGALDNDSPQLPAIQQRLADHDLLPAEQYVDQGYMSADHLAESEDRGITLLGPPPLDTSPDTGFRQENFQIDMAAHQVICPAGQTNQLWSQAAPTAKKPNRIQVRFDPAICQTCRFFGQCTTSARGRTLELLPERDRLNAYRQLAQTEDFQVKLHLRAGVESTFSELVRKYRFRLARYRGLARLRLQLYFTAIAVNLARLVRWWNHQNTLESCTA